MASLTRKFLSALGIEPDKVDEIISAHVEVTDALKAERDQYKADAVKLADVQAELDGLKADAAKNGGKNPFEVKYNAIKEEFENFKADLAAKESKAAKESAYRALLKEAGISEKRIEAVLKVSDLDSVKLDGDGKIEGKEKLVEGIKTEWSDFITEPVQQGAQTAKPPASSGAVDYDSLSDREYYAATYEAAKKKG